MLETIRDAGQLAAKMEECNAFMCFMPEKLYDSAPALSRSLLTEYQYSPAHFKWRLDHPIEETKEMLIGRAFHSWVLDGRDVFEAQYVRMPKFDRRTKKGKAEAEAWDQENKSRTALTGDDYDYVTKLGDAFLANTDMMKFVRGGLPEVSAFIKDAETALWIKTRMDVWHPQQPAIVDLKTTGKKATARSFGYSVRDYNYHVQEALYTDVAEAIIGRELKGFRFLVIEKHGPFGMRSFKLGERYVEKGRQLYREWLNMHVECTKNNYWPAYESGSTLLDPPEWVYQDD